MKRKIWVRPGKTQSAASVAVGVIFLLIGIFIVIPSFGPFGFLWTAIVGVMIVMNLYNLFSDKGIVSHEIKIEDNEDDKDDSYEDTARESEHRLETLKSMHDKGLITDEEYENKKKEILDEI